MNISKKDTYKAGGAFARARLHLHENKSNYKCETKQLKPARKTKKQKFIGNLITNTATTVTKFQLVDRSVLTSNKAAQIHFCLS